MSVRSRRRVVRGGISAVVAAAALITHDAKAAATAYTASQPAHSLAAGRILGGLTSARWPVVFAVTPSGKRISEADVALDMRCTSGDQFTAPDAFFRVPIAANGSVNATQSIPAITGTSITGGSHSLSAKLDYRHATIRGVWELHLNFAMPNGQTDQCDTGRVAFRARL